MKFTFTLVLLSVLHIAFAQKLKKNEKVILANLRTHVTFLADDKLEGRRTGTSGEKLAYEYLISEYEKSGLGPKGENGTYLQKFNVNEGKQVDGTSHLIINGNDLRLNEEYFPLATSPNNSIEAIPVIALQESGVPWFYDIKDLLDINKANPHYDLLEGIRLKVNEFQAKGATALFIYNTSATDDGLKFEGKSKAEPWKIPVIYFTKKAKEKYLNDDQVGLDVKLVVNIKDKIRYGHNVISYLDNGAASTIINGAHYDHLGYGEDKNSLFTGGPSIHNGADDNASGTAAVLELAKMLKASSFKKNNYLFISFSGEELGLFGSKFFTEHPTIDLSRVNYMINLDMVGRLNDSSKSITVGGFGTSPSWGNIVLPKTKTLTIKIDSSGTGPSDHTSFYRKDIPVLFFFTGTHSDYHKPGDDVEKINFAGELLIMQYIYSLVEKTNSLEKLAFSKTREQQMGASTRFTVSLGIMPDYSFSGNGVRVDGISEGKLAQKIGLKAGDVVIELGEYKFSDVTAYMGALSKFKKGDSAKLKVKRGNEDLVFDITF
ncbi:MAG: M28 family peptidase [Chitinophagaceae bacterium]